MTPDPEESEGSRMVGVQQQHQRQEGEQGEQQVVVKNCSNQKKFFVCPNCNQKKKSILRSSSEQTESAASVVRPSKNEVRVCKKCRKSTSSDPAAPGSTTTTTEKKKRRSVATVFHPHWTHYCFLLTIYLVFSVILYYLTLNQQQSE